MTWGDWRERHGNLFALSGPEHVAMFAAWIDSFVRQGFTPEEVTAASEWLANNDPPGYRDQHLAALNRRVCEGRKQAEMQRSKRAEATPYYCKTCNDTGLASVPNFEGIERWKSWRTCAVACSCVRGQQFKAKNASIETLTQYERQYPGWRDAAKRHDEELQAQARASGAASALDKMFGQILKRR